MTELVPYVAVGLHAVSVALGVVILHAAWETLRPTGGVHLMWWHVLAITLGVWGWHSLFVLRMMSDAGDFGTAELFVGPSPTWLIGIGFLLLILDDLALWLILKVQRGRYRLQRNGS